METRTHTTAERTNGHFGPCPDCPHKTPPALQLNAGSGAIPGSQGANDSPCHETDRRAGNPAMVGTLEHETIQYDYKATHNAAREYLIPESGKSGGFGYADIVDLADYGIWEIKE